MSAGTDATADHMRDPHAGRSAVAHGAATDLRLTPDQAPRVHAMNAASNARLRAHPFPDRPCLSRSAMLPGTAPVTSTELSQVTGN